MAKKTLMGVGKLLAASIMAAGAVLAIPAGPADAAPCEWQFNGPFKIALSNGVKTSWDTDQNKGLTGIALMFDGKTSWNGDESGGINGQAVNITTTWFMPGGDKVWNYSGNINGNGLVAGSVSGNGGPGSGNGTFTSSTPLRCIPANVASGVTVNGDVDLYDVPDGVGNIIGILRKGTSVELTEPCRDGWCHVKQGWVWGEFLNQ